MWQLLNVRWKEVCEPDRQVSSSELMTCETSDGDANDDHTSYTADDLIAAFTAALKTVCSV